MFSTSSFDATTSIWMPSNNSFDNDVVLEGHENEVKCCRWAPSGELLATTSRDKSMWVWELLEDGEFECVGVLQDHSQDVKGCCWHPESTMLVSFSYDNMIKLYTEVDGDWELKKTFGGHQSTCWRCCFSPCGRYLVSVGDDLMICVWDVSSFELITKIDGLHSDPIYSVDWSQNGVIATAGGTQVKLLKFDGQELEILDTINEPHGQYDVNHCLFSKATGYHDYLATCGDDCIVNLYKVTC